MSSSGPILPKRCVTIELKDLADLDEFEDHGEVGEIYGLQLTEDGTYVRKPIDNDKEQPLPSFNQLRDVQAGGARNGIKYLLRRQNNRWKIEPYIDIKWDIQFTFKSGYTFAMQSGIFKKAFNEAMPLVSLITKQESRGEVLLQPYMIKKHMLVQKQGITKASLLEFIPEIPLPRQYTIIIDLVAPRPLSSVTTQLIPGLRLAFKAEDVTEDPLRFIITLQKTDDEIVSHSSNDKMKLSTNNFTKLDVFNLNFVSLIGFYFTDEVLSQYEIEQFMDTEFIN